MQFGKYGPDERERLGSLQEGKTEELKEEKSNRGEDTAASVKLFCKGS